MNNALKPAGWTLVSPVAQDGSARRYFRMKKNGVTAILMDHSDGLTCGHDPDDFVSIAGWLRDIGLKAPEIYESGEDYLLVEDFGDVSFKKAMEKGKDAAQLYALADNVLKELAGHSCPLDLPLYEDSHVHKGRRRVIDWYMPLALGRKNPDGLVEDYLAVWEEIENTLPSVPRGFLHIDYHVENLMFLPGEKGLKQCGILDFQGAMHGPQPYDLANLLEDPRHDCGDGIRHQLLQDYPEEFQLWYRVLATQFHCRVIGQFIKMAVQDNKTAYLDYIPRLESYLRSAFEHPALQPLKSFFSASGLDFTKGKDLNIAQMQGVIRKDAF